MVKPANGTMHSNGARIELPLNGSGSPPPKGETCRRENHQKPEFESPRATNNHCKYLRWGSIEFRVRVSKVRRSLRVTVPEEETQPKAPTVN